MLLVFAIAIPRGLEFYLPAAEDNPLIEKIEPLMP
jgi:hypothetical protein